MMASRLNWKALIVCMPSASTSSVASHVASARPVALPVSDCLICSKSGRFSENTNVAVSAAEKP